MSFRSSSSSPDVLGPPGDAEYLISSPVKPFAGRQSFMSPANFRPLRTPHKRKRISFSPTKSSHSIKFDDVLLPASPTMKLNGRQRTPSPDKMETDENVSPWRIRVTLEATQDENNQGSPGRKRLSSPTKTTKVPLRDEDDVSMQTPTRRRGRPRKSDVQVRNATPIPGSPGHTPGPQGTVGQKRKRGRPRKSAPESDLPEDTHPHDQTPGAEPEQSWSPINMAVDGDSDDGLPDNDLQMGESGQGTWNRSPQRVTFEPEYNTPDVGAIDRDYMGNDAYLNSTPSKMPSPTRESENDPPGNTLHAGHTPPPRSLPTPTSSSQVGDEPQEQEGHAPGSENRSHHGLSHPTADPTDDHREFDSIMESEGFSMVSLDTLPSAKQHALHSSTTLAKGPLKPFLERKSTGTSDRVKRQSPLSYTNRRDHLSPDKDTLPKDSYPAASTHSPDSNLPKEQATANGHSPANEDLSPERLYPDLPSHSPGPRPRSSQNQPTINGDSPFNKHTSPERLYPKLPSDSPDRRFSPGYPTSNGRTPANDIPEPRNTPIVRKRPLLRLARILRVGIALEGTLREHNAGNFVIESRRKRLETLFSDLHPEIQRDLCAGLELAKEFAKRISWVEAEKRRQQELEVTTASQNDAKKASEGRTPQEEQAGETITDSPNPEMKRRMAEWQREREAVSREIETAHSNQVIVIDSDTPQNEQDDYGNADDYDHAENDYEHERHSGKELGQPIFDEEEPEQPDFDEPEVEREEHTQPEEAASDEEDEEDDYEDIWQQEAKDQSHMSHRSSTNHNLQERQQQPSSHSSSSRKSSPVTASRNEVGTSSPAIWPRNNNLVPDLGYSRVRHLREQKVDLSPLYREQYTPRRYNYYYGKSSPQSAIKQLPQHQPPTEYSDQNHQSQEHSKSSPANGAISQQQNLARFESPGLHSVQNLHEDENQDASDDAASEERSVHEQLDVTPHPPRQTNADTQGSSWFQKLTSFTPGWLRAPKTEPVEGKILENEEEEAPETEKVPRLTSFTPSWLKAPTAQPNEEEFEESSEPPSARVGRTARADLEDPLEDIAETPEASSPVEQRQVHRRRTPLAVSGYFTDEHYAALRRLYRLAKRYPEYFPYYPRPGHSDIIGDWIWTSDAAYGVPVTEGQFAVVDRFAQDLADASLEHGGPGQIGWTEADLHRRLISIIIGEQIRGDRKKDTKPEETRRSESRETSVDIWRP